MTFSAKNWLPFVAVAAIALWWVVALREPETDGAQPADPSVVPDTTNLTTPVDDAPEAAMPKPGSSVWPTYHGDGALTGVAAVSLPDELSRAWSYQAKGPVYAAPVASADAIVYSTADGWIGAIDTEGAEIWSRQFMRTPSGGGDAIPEAFEAPVACFGGTVFLGSTHGTLYSLDETTGETRWTYDVGGPVLGTVNLIPASNDGESERVIVIDQADGALQCLDAETGEPIWRTEGIDRCDGSPSVGTGTIVFGSCAAALHVFSPADGQLLRNIDLGSDSQVAGGVALVDGSAFSGSNSGNVVRANVSSGELVWVNEDSDAEVFTTPAVNENRVVFGSLDGNVYALKRATGAKIWSFQTDGEPSSAVIAGDKVAFSSDGTLYLLRLDTGERLWSYDVSDYTSSPAVVGGMVVVGSDDGTVTAFH